METKNKAKITAACTPAVQTFRPLTAKRYRQPWFEEETIIMRYTYEYNPERSKTSVCRAGTRYGSDALRSAAGTPSRSNRRPSCRQRAVQSRAECVKATAERDIVRLLTQSCPRHVTNRGQYQVGRCISSTLILSIKCQLVMRSINNRKPIVNNKICLARKQ